MQPIQHSGYISTHSRDLEHSSRPVEQTQETIVRIYNPKENVQPHTKTMGNTKNRRLFSSTQQPVTNVLDSSTRSTSFSNGCDETNMVTEGNVPLPSVEIDSTSLEENTTTEVETSSIDNTMVAQSVLVPHDSTDETSTTTNTLENQSKMDSSRLAVINNYRLQDGIKEETLSFLNQKTRSSTNKI